MFPDPFDFLVCLCVHITWVSCPGLWLGRIFERLTSGSWSCFADRRKVGGYVPHLPTRQPQSRVWRVYEYESQHPCLQLIGVKSGWTAGSGGSWRGSGCSWDLAKIIALAGFSPSLASFFWSTSIINGLPRILIQGSAFRKSNLGLPDLYFAMGFLFFFQEYVFCGIRWQPVLWSQTNLDLNPCHSLAWTG